MQIELKIKLTKKFKKIVKLRASQQKNQCIKGE